MPLMSPETLEFLLLLSGWIVAFLLGRELQIGFRQWRLRTADQRTPDSAVYLGTFVLCRAADSAPRTSRTGYQSMASRAT